MKQTNWTQATTNLYEAIAGLLAAQANNKNAWIEEQKNGEQDFPIMIKNPELDNPFNWTMSFGVPARIENHQYFNETEKDLTENWTASFGEVKAIRNYQQNNKLSKNLVKGIGVCFPLRKKDFLKLRPDLPKNFNLWFTYWKPKDEIPYRVVNKQIKSVYVVCTDNQELNEKQSLQNLKNFVNSL